MSEPKLSSIYLPQAVYESLPILYFLGGVATLLNLDHQMAHLSGALLIVTSFQVTFMRLKARRYAARAGRSDGEMAMIGMSWLHHYQVGIPKIDHEHEHLFELSHEVLEAISQGNGHSVRESIEELSDAIRTHFRHEETILKEMGHPKALSHAKMHHRLESKMDALLKKFLAGKVDRNVIAHFMLFEVVRQHMLEQDVELSAPGR